MTQENSVLVIQRTINASAEQLFDAWTKPELMKQWFRANDKMTTTVAEADLRVGGAWRVEMKTSTGSTYPNNGQYKIIDRPKKLVFTWHPNEEADYETVVTLIFKKVKKNVTDFKLTQEGFRNEEDKADHTDGWTGCISILEKWAGSN